MTEGDGQTGGNVVWREGMGSLGADAGTTYEGFGDTGWG